MTRGEAIEVLEEVKMLDDSMFAYSQVYNDALDMAIKALKAQEPRVVTLKELLALKKNTPVYIECISGSCGWDVFSGIDNYTSVHDCVMTGAPWAVKEYWRQSLYNVSWRCWTSEPSAQRREAVEWD